LLFTKSHANLTSKKLEMLMNVPMSDISTTKMTSKGQVVIPEAIREYMHLESGAKFIVMATNDSIIFKKVISVYG